jgi:hypothetical protein
MKLAPLLAAAVILIRDPTGKWAGDPLQPMQVDDRLVNLSPGMAVTVEINTDTRRIISYLLSPLARYTHESLRER